MRYIEEKSCYNLGPPQEISGSSNISFEFHKGNGTANRGSHHCTALGKPTPSKWDDAQKWLVGSSRGGEKKNQSKTRPWNSNADDRRSIAPVPSQKVQHYSGDEDDEAAQEHGNRVLMALQYGVETKNVDCDESIWWINKPVDGTTMLAVRSISVRDMGTEMIPIASQEPSRPATPIRATTPAARSPIS